MFQTWEILVEMAGLNIVFNVNFYFIVSAKILNLNWVLIILDIISHLLQKFASICIEKKLGKFLEAKR